MLTARDAEIKAMDHDHAITTADDCSKCNKSGQVTIYFKPLYRGQPWVMLQKRDGTPYKFHVRAIAFCDCLVGTWYRLHNPEHDPRRPLQVAEKMPGWTIRDPATSDLPPDIAGGNWQNFSRWLREKNRGKSVVQPLPKQPARAAPNNDPILKAAGHPAADDGIPF